MSQVKNRQKENLKLKGEISAVNSELQKLKSIIEQQELQADIEQIGDAATRYGNSIQKSVDFLWKSIPLSVKTLNISSFRKKIKSLLLTVLGNEVF